MDVWADGASSSAAAAVSADAAAHYGAFLSLLLDEDNNGSVLWHCSAGKDRVGLGTALLLSVLGVPRELILEDFAASGIFLSLIHI